MKHDYRPFIGRAYEPPHGCFRLVQQVFEEAYSLVLADHAAGLAPGRDARMARFQQQLSTHCMPITDPQEGDLIIITLGGKPWHIGIVVAPGEMLHSYQGGGAVIESYNDMRWRSRIEGFYRAR